MGEGGREIDGRRGRRDGLDVQFLSIDPVHGHHIGAEARDQQSEGEQDQPGTPSKPPQTQTLLLNQ